MQLLRAVALVCGHGNGAVDSGSISLFILKTSSELRVLDIACNHNKLRASA